jgi:hypothetical protein
MQSVDALVEARDSRMWRSWMVARSRFDEAVGRTHWIAYTHGTYKHQAMYIDLTRQLESHIVYKQSRFLSFPLPRRGAPEFGEERPSDPARDEGARWVDDSVSG